MKKSLKTNYIIEIILLIFIIILNIFQKSYPQYMLIINLIFWVLLTIILYFINGIPRFKGYLNNISIRYIIIALFSYLLITYLLGLFTGFLKTMYIQNILGILKNVIPVILLIICKEIVRYILTKNAFNNKLQLVIIGALFVIFDISLKYNSYDFSDASKIFTFVFLVLLPTIARETLCTYMTYKISFLPTLIYVLALEISVYLFPIYPDLGNYLNSVIGLIFPFIIYKQISKLVKYNDKKTLNVNKYCIPLIVIPVFIFLTTIIILISGIFSHKMIAIGSDSMNPVYYRGDAIIYQKVEVNNIKKNDILVFENNGSVITHRVINIIYEDGKIYFQTKGDNNEKKDDLLINETSVLGIVKYIVKYIGYPTIWINEKF